MPNFKPHEILVMDSLAEMKRMHTLVAIKEASAHGDWGDSYEGAGTLWFIHPEDCKPQGEE